MAKHSFPAYAATIAVAGRRGITPCSSLTMAPAHFRPWTMVGFGKARCSVLNNKSTNEHLPLYCSKEYLRTGPRAFFAFFATQFRDPDVDGARQVSDDGTQPNFKGALGKSEKQAPWEPKRTVEPI